MIVHLIGSLHDYETNPEMVEDLRAIANTIHDNDSSLSHNWIEAAIIRHEKNVIIPDWTPYVEDNLAALHQSDVVIIEATPYSFGLGFQMAAALHHQKPVLVVSRERLKYKYISGFVDNLLTYKTYSNRDELARTVSAFLQKNTVHTKDLRFNIMLTRKISKFLDEKTKETGKNRSEVIRDIIKSSDTKRK